MPPATSPRVCMVISATKALQGDMAILTSEPDALVLAQILVSEPPDNSAAFDKDRRDAYEELIRQVFGQVATSLKKAAGGEVDVKPTGSEVPSWTGASRVGIRMTERKIRADPISLLVAGRIEKSLEPRPAAPALPRKAATNAPVTAAPAADDAQTKGARSSNLELLLDVKLNATIRFGQKQMLLREILELHPGTAVALDRQVEEPVELLVGGRVVAQGNVVIVDGNYGIRITEILSPQQRIESLRKITMSQSQELPKAAWIRNCQRARLVFKQQPPDRESNSRCENLACRQPARYYGLAWLRKTTESRFQGQWYCGPDCFEHAAQFVICTTDPGNARNRAQKATTASRSGCCCCRAEPSTTANSSRRYSLQRRKGSGKIGKILQQMQAASEQDITEGAGGAMGMPHISSWTSTRVSAVRVTSATHHAGSGTHAAGALPAPQGDPVHGLCRRGGQHGALCGRANAACADRALHRLRISTLLRFRVASVPCQCSGSCV